MLFNSFSFIVFLPIVFLLYWFIPFRNIKWQNILLLVSSYFFYACWDWRFLFLLLFSTFLDYFTGLRMYDAQSINTKKMWFWLSIIINLGFLGVFKYFDFFVLSFADLLSNYGLKVHPYTLNIILPVGISFYTFHGLSYVIDIYYNRIKPEKEIVDYALFVSFFPLLVAGPIERATHLLPQIKKVRKFDYSDAVSGLRQILWGFFKKIVIADSCAVFANEIFQNQTEYSGSTLLLGAFFFTIQIYGDFSGYSDIALGTAKLFGIKLLKNFAFPYFSRDIAEFWRRWHISLSSWFKDYLYIPLGGSKGGNWLKIKNTFIIFIVSGFWHGANWTFIIWGFLNAIYILPSIILKKNRINLDIVAKGKLFPNSKETFSMLLTFSLTMFAWIFFRSDNVQNAFNYINELFSVTFFTIPYFSGIRNSIGVIIFIIIFFIIEWLGRENDFAIERFGFKWTQIFRKSFYAIVTICIYYFATNSSVEQFIYFQF